MSSSRLASSFRIALAALAAVTALGGACGGSTDDPAKPGGDAGNDKLPCEVERVLAASCRTCHTSPPKFGAPMSLVTYADLHKDAVTHADKKVFEMVGVRTHDDAKPMPEPPRPRLNAADQKVLDDWIAAGAPSGEGSCGGDASTKDAPGPVIVDPPAGCPNVTLKAGTKYTMPASETDQYVCYGVDVTLSKKRHITSFWPKIDNDTIAHHAIVYLADRSVSPEPVPCASGAIFGRRIVYGWAPGGNQFELPAEAGLPLEGTTHFVVQMHYSNLQKLQGQTDQSEIGLCTTDELRPNDADVLAFGSMSFEVPARKSLRVDCDLDVPQGLPELTLFRSMPHMHQLGRTIGSTRDRAGALATIDEVTNWSFGSQPWNPVANVSIKPGDRVHTWCSWTNPYDYDVPFGEETSREMCYHFLMYYPRIVTPGWNWQAPIAAAKCKSQ